MLWLRWRLTRNQWSRGGGLNAAIALVVLVVALVLALVGGVGGVTAGALALSGASPQVAMLTWDGLVALFLLFWMMGLVTDMQRSEIIDVRHLLHLPIALRDAFLLNYLASHLSLSLAIMLPAMLGLTAGLVLGRGPAMLLLVPLVLAFFFMITAWTYCLRGWLATLMVNKRRRRAIIMAVTMAFVLLVQLPNVAFNVWNRGRFANLPRTASAMEQWAKRDAENRAALVFVLDQAHLYVPVLWLPRGARALAQGDASPALWCILGMGALGTWGLRRAYRGTLRFYGGVETGKVAPAPPAARTIDATGKILVEWNLPAIPQDAAAMALATFRSISRAPEVKMVLMMNVILLVFLGTSVLLSSGKGFPAGGKPLAASTAVGVAFLGLMHVMFNHFGFDRDGFRALVLSPTSRGRILLGKNLALLPVALVVFAVYLGLATVLARLRAMDVLTAGFEFVGAFLATSVLGNVASILVPHRIAAGSLNPTKTAGTTVLVVMASQLFLVLAMLPVFLPAGLELLGDGLHWRGGAAIALVCAVLLAALSALLYWRTLPPLGRLLQRREQRILQVVTQEVE
jgi:hypothetical protein